MKAKYLILLMVLCALCCIAASCTPKPHTHDWGEWQVTVSPTCNEEGEERRVCQTDGAHTETRSIPIDPNAHNMVHMEPKASTCSSTGFNEHDECSRCGYSPNKVETPIDADAHDIGELIEEVPADCENDGVKEHYSCSLCHKNFDENMAEIDDNDLIIEKYGHLWDSGKVIAEATCKSAGSILYTCHWDESHTYTEEIPINPQAHVWETELTKENKKRCSICLTEQDIYTLSSDGKKVYFGEYPQTEVKDSDLKTVLNKQAGSKPDGLFPNRKWISYRYYANGKQSDFMWYQDISYENAKYRGVYFSKYRPEWTTKNYDKSESMIDNSGYNAYTVYWFKFEPIEWRILSKEDGGALLMSEMIVDSQQYYQDDEDRTLNGKTVHASNYANSDIRTWLNADFYDTAFDSYCKQIIEKTLVDNSADSVDPNKRDYLSQYEYVCENTEDNVFLLSYKEINGVNGFAAGDTPDPLKLLKGTDYAKIQGLDYMYDTPFWRLRSPTSKTHGQVVFYNGYSGNGHIAHVTSDGIVPALKIKL